MAAQLGAAVRPPARGAGGAHRPRPGAGRRGRRRTYTAELDKLLAKGRVSTDQANRLKALVTGSLTKDAFADADFVIEAVFEELSVKQQVFAEVEAVVRPDCVLATNTSSLSVSEMAAELEHPERVVGFHFFNPVAVLPLLEIVRAEATDDAALATAFAVGKQLKKSCVLVKDAPAFVVNRLLTRFLGEITSVGRRGHPGRGGRARAGAAGPADVAVRAARSWSGRPSRCTWPRPCTRRSRTGTRSRPSSAAWSRRARPASTCAGLHAGPRGRGRAVRRRPAVDRGSGPPARAGGPGPGDRPHAGRAGRRRRPRTSTCA